MMFFLLAAAGAAVLDQEGLRRLNSLLEVNAKASGEMKARSADEIKTLIEDSHVQFRIDTPNVRVTKEDVEILASDEWVVFAPRPGNKETVFPVAYDKARSKITVNGVEVTDGGVKCEHLPEECACNSVALTSRGVVVRHDENKPQVCTWKFEIAEK